jgi:hypothetical protein
MKREEREEEYSRQGEQQNSVRPGSE